MTPTTETQAILDAMAANPLPPAWEVGPVAARQNYEVLRAALGPGEPDRIDECNPVASHPSRGHGDVRRERRHAFAGRATGHAERGRLARSGRPVDTL